MKRVKRKLSMIGMAMAIAIVGGGSLGGISSAQAPAPPPIEPPGLSHFLCYFATAVPSGPQFERTPPSVQLTDQFGPQNAGIVRLGRHCNPSAKIDPTGQVISPIVDPATHLDCWEIQRPPTDKNVVVRNQWGQGQLHVGDALDLCLPSWKSETGPFPPPAVEPPGLDHFECYRVDPLAGTPGGFAGKPTVIGAQDQFGGQLLQVLAPTRLCNPVEKVAPW